ncbi:hypothetical protein PCASD_05843 [Puccinia coronata f. sp. avenae]|uniref:Uncharacterized protein n=1 Tax=Puccinia coronata f. sp. avenae TaxID=200324 RepID=A0A2N5V422_9BASI|nr:hypothetical protein PCASD_05843 [Puccinia coronata f. sp. avenae]
MPPHPDSPDVGAPFGFAPAPEFNLPLFPPANPTVDTYPFTDFAPLPTPKPLGFFNPSISLPALTGRTQQFERCSNSRVRPVVGQALSDQSTCRRVGQACPISSWDRSHRTSQDRSDKSVRPVGSCFGRTVPVRPPRCSNCRV